MVCRHASPTLAEPLLEPLKDGLVAEKNIVLQVYVHLGGSQA